MGCTDIEAKAWNRHRFRIDSESLYRIRSGFPRLTTSMLPGRVAPHGVHKITYQVDLSAAAPFLCDEAVLTDLEERFAS